MPGGWSKQFDVVKLADAQTELEYSIPVGELPGIDANAGSPGPLLTRLVFGREQGLPVVDIAVSGALELQCQRCLRSFELPLALESRVVLLLSERDADRAPASRETFLVMEGRVSAAALVGEEVLLAVPLVPLHEDATQCVVETAVKVAPAEAAAASAGTRRPFADLQALLDRGRR